MLRSDRRRPRTILRGSARSISAIFAVKLYDFERAAEAIRPLVRPGTGVVTLQNGVDSTDVLARAVRSEHVIGGVANIASVIAEPGVVRHTGTMARVVFGELDGRRSERVTALAQALHEAGVDHRLSDNIRRDIWDKMVLLSAFSGLTALMRLPIGPIREEPETRATYREGLAEALAVARAKGIELPDDLAEQKLAQTDALPYQMRSSMLEISSADVAWSCPGCWAPSCGWAKRSGSPRPSMASSRPRSSCTLPARFEQKK